MKTPIAAAGQPDAGPAPALDPTKSEEIRAELKRIERRQWWLLFSGIAVTLLLTAGILSLTLPVFARLTDFEYPVSLAPAVRGLLGTVLLFDVYVIYQQLQIQRIREKSFQREELFRVITENAEDMIAVVDVNGQRLYNSPAYEKFLGYTLDELQKTSAYEQIHPDDQQKVLEAAQHARSTGVGRRVDYRIRHKSGDWRVVESTASVVRDSGGEVRRLVIVNRDITERKQLEQQLYLSQKLEAVGRLSGGIAHDFNNLLGVIIGYSQVLQKRIKENTEFREAVDEILKAGKRAASLTQQLLAFSRKQVLEPRVLGLNTVVTDVEKMLRRLIGEDIELKIELDAELGMVRADPTQIEQVILNLAVNARDAMPRGGKLSIRTSNAALSQKDARLYSYVIPGNYILLEVTDTGCGMDAELRSHIFEPFFTTKEKGKGTGLGLATVYGVIKQSGGYIWVDSEPGEGTTFRMYLPRIEKPGPRNDEPKEAVRHAFKPLNVLLVEDEQSLRRLTRNILADSGCTVYEAQDTSDAIQIANRSDLSIDLLLTDVIMPGMSGPALAKKLLTFRPRLRVLYMSGYTDGTIAPHGVLEPKTQVLRKPFTGEELLRTITHTVAEPVEK